MPLRDTIILKALVMFLVFYAILVAWRPAAVFDSRGNTRPFGIGRAQTTVTPLWMCVMMLAVLSYAAAKRLA
jgi:uncharacterized membrane protein YozB (DUF420 family)